jgi:hypothetical protein
MDGLSSLPSYPKGPEPELPPPRSGWSTFLWVGLAIALSGGMAAIVIWLLPGLWVFAFVPELLVLMGVGLAGFAFALLLLFIYAWQRSDRHDS